MAQAVLLLAVSVVALIQVRSACAQGLNPCAGSNLPSPVTEVIRTKFSGWRPEQILDLGPDDRQLWLKAHLNDCPGIAAGHFESVDRLTYAVLLVRPSAPTNGFKILVLNKMSSAEAYAWKLVEQADGPTYGGIVIEKAPAGHYSDYEDARISVTTRLDGFYLEFIEKGAILYYWSARRYKTVRVSG
jgi:hypothetical protein